jgi:branched-chain amino acid transport system substrate-binding protein
VSFLIRILLTFVMAAAWAQLAAPAWGQAPAIVVGAALSQTGQLASLAADYRKALLLWQDEVNAAGGLLGRRVELDLRDDQSDARRSGELYAELIRGKADLLIGPYGSAATLMASAEAERAQRVLINGAGASAAVHKRSPRYLFQTTIPNSAYGVGVLELAKAAGIASVVILARDDQMVREMAEAARERAVKEEFKAAEIEIYGGGIADFAPYVAKVRDGAYAWLAFGELHDAAAMLRSFRKLDYAPRLFFARSAADPRLVALVGQDAEFALAPREYDPKLKTSGNERFAAAFAAKWSSPPTFAAAQGYAAATVLAEAVRRARSLDQAKLRALLAQMETDTVLGGYKVDPQSGEQRAAKPAVVQIQRGKPEVVWPEWLQTATLRPYPQWSERRPLK